MVTHINSNYRVYMVEHGTMHYFCNWKHIKPLLKKLNISTNDVIIYEFIDNAKMFIKSKEQIS